MPYVPFNADWQDTPSSATPITAAALEYIEAGIVAAHVLGDGSIQKSIADAKGDIIVASSLDAVSRMPVGADNTVLVADSSQGLGLLWAKITNAMIAAGAAIDISKLAGYPSDVTKYLAGDGSWNTISIPQGSPSGAIIPYGGISAPSGWLTCDGTQVVRATYPNLWAALALSRGTFTVTIASPGVFTLNGHTMAAGDAVYLTTTGALPTGLAQNTTYYLVATVDANTFRLATTRGGAAINTSGSQSGVHTLVHAPWGIPAGSTTDFLLPDLRGRVFVGRGSNAAVSAVGMDDGVAIANRRPQHRHSPHFHGMSGTSSVGGGIPAIGAFDTVVTHNTQSKDGGSGVATDALDAPAHAVGNWIIKT